MSLEEMALLKPLNASLGLMLENVSPRFSQKACRISRRPTKLRTRA